MPSGIWRGNWTASWSGQGSALGGGEAESSLATVSSTRCSNPSHALSGLWVRSSQLTRSARVWPSCSACTHTPDTAGANQRDFLITCPTSGNQYRPTRPHTESSGEAGTGPAICGAWMTSCTLGGSGGESERTYWVVSAKNDENVLMYAATSRRSASDRRPFHAGIALPGSPSSIALIRSASVGS